MGALYAWGYNYQGQLGIPSTAGDMSSPVVIAGSWQQLAADPAGAVLGIKSTGTLWAVGNNSFGQLGLGDVTNRASFIQVGTSSWTQIAAGGSAFASPAPNGFFLGILAGTGALYAWGTNGSGQLGDGTVTARSSPVKIGALSYSVIAAGAFHSMAILAGGTGALYTWGAGSSGQLGSNAIANRSSPVQIGALSYSVIAAGYYHSMALLAGTGALYTWGNNGSGQLGDGTVTARSSPVKIGALSYSAVAAGEEHSMAILAGGTGALYTWGQGTYGQLGSNATSNRSSPVKIGALSYSAVAAGRYHSLAILADGTGALYAWGDNTYGQLGDGTVTARSSPVKIGTSSYTVIGASMGSSNSLLRDTTGIQYGTGYNNLGQILPNTYVSPVQIGSSSWAAVAAGTSFSLALLADGTGALYAWGNNTYGQLGDGTVTTRASPVKIGALSYSVIAAGYYHNVALLAGGTGALYTWGYGNFGQLGNGFNANRSSPVKIGALSYSVIAAGQYHSMAILAGGTGALYAWGYNVSGQLGDGTTTTRSSPVKIGALSYSAISAGINHSLAVLAGGTGALYAWGLNSSGQLGDGTFVNKLSPVKIGTSSWTVVSSTHNSNDSFAITI
jgi:alpha-tubulin suppressor-like RCC1 family protein